MADLQQVTLVVPQRLAEPLSDALLAVGALSVANEDADAGSPLEEALFAEPGETLAALWSRQRLTLIFAADADVDDLMALAAAHLAISVPDYRVAPLVDTDWVRSSQQQFEPIEVTPRLWVVPSWCEPPCDAAMVIRLDPGLAFGTGSHPTTQLCLRWLADRVAVGDSLLDYGCGSGILAIAAAKLGAARVHGLDIDPDAVAVARDNAAANGVTVSFTCEPPPQQHFDWVVANILANPLRLLAPAIATLIRPGGSLALAGLLTEQADELIAVYAPWARLSVVAEQEGWVCLAGVRQQG